MPMHLAPTQGVILMQDHSLPFSREIKETFKTGKAFAKRAA